MKLIILLVLCGLATSALINVAPNGTASQSSMGWSGVASRAIDGNTEGKWSGRSCTHSRYNKGNWWKVDLAGAIFGSEYPVSGVTIHNRKDCCSDRINGAVVYVGTTECGKVTYVNGQSKYIVMCAAPIKGSSVTVKLSNNYLTLCEVEVWVDETKVPKAPPYTNVARQGSASQSSYGWGGVASRGVDGKTDGQWSSGTCTHSRYNKNNWWKVDLKGAIFGVEYPVSMVIIYNRQDCCQDRINGAKVYVGDKVCGTVAYKADQSVYTIKCATELKAGSVKVVLNSNYLTLCEVQIWIADDKIPSLPYNNAAMGTGVKSTQTSTGWGGVASRAIDGNTNGYWNGGSCTHTARAGQSWSVSLPNNVTVDHVIIYNRLDCCSNRINGAVVYVGSTVCGTVAYVNGKTYNTVQCPGEGISGQKLTVKAASNQYLTLCEVKIMVKTEESGTEEIEME